ncbi:MAG: ChbG/HpnK family deacetylase [Candidatus Fermentibacteraceae bacterium]|nr:ChbG/HpnK family deacetylase [Candidatus Fermentibacteraceae bacterium]MBN2608670.1 ChbG/HpnK family deacetylase [Candidatus Fermentibacteraceae bacterium]
MKVLVTIDDLGMSPGINAAAAVLLPTGVVGCVSIMATGPALMEAVEISMGSRAMVSVHLNCLQPPFLTGGEFPSSHETWFLKGRRLAGRVREEWSRQIEKLLSCGLMVTRLDSHHHIHNAPGLRDVTLELAREYGISAVRAAVLPDRRRSLEALLLDWMGRRLAGAAKSRGISTPDAMLGFSAAGSMSREYLEEMEEGIRGAGTAELVTHPAVSPEWSLYQPLELELMRSDWFRRWLSAR